MEGTRWVAGHELDRVIAERVMGEKAWAEHDAYTTDMVAAWRVVEKVGLLDRHVLAGNTVEGWEIFEICNGSEGWYPEYVVGTCPEPILTVPLAICVAALKVVEGKGRR